MSWNHRVIRSAVPGGGVWYTIHEVYDMDDDDKINAMTTDAVSPAGETLEELVQSLQWMLNATKAPVLDEEDVVGKPMHNQGE